MLRVPDEIRCCRARPRCRRCPVLLATELREVERFARGDDQLPEHLRGVPASLHRYEPLLRRSWEQAQAQAPRVER